MKQKIVLAGIFLVTSLHGAYCIYTTGHVSAMFPVYIILSFIGLTASNETEQ